MTSSQPEYSNLHWPWRPGALADWEIDQELAGPGTPPGRRAALEAEKEDRRLLRARAAAVVQWLRAREVLQALYPEWSVSRDKDGWHGVRHDPGMTVDGEVEAEAWVLIARWEARRYLPTLAAGSQDVKGSR